jgi:hypothetical protein
VTVVAFAVNPKGLPITVNLTKQGTTTHIYYDEALSKQADGAVVNTTTTFYIAAHGTYQLSLKDSSTELATWQNQPLNVDIRNEVAPQVFQPQGPLTLVGSLPGS